MVAKANESRRFENSRPVVPSPSKKYVTALVCCLRMQPSVMLLIVLSSLLFLLDRLLL